MRTPLLIIALVALLSGSAPGSPLDPPANHPSGMAEVAWGASPADAKKAMLARTGVTLVSEAKEKLVFAGGVLADQPVDSWELQFIADKFAEATVRIKPSDALRQYEDICKLITAKYRKPGRETKESAEHRATYWEYALTTGKWGIACDVRIPGSLLLKYKDKSPANQPGKSSAKDL